MATRGIVPRANGEGKIGTAEKKWGEVNTNAITADSVTTGQITASGAITADSVTTGQGILTPDRTLLKRNTAYKVGDIATSPNLPSWAYLECVTAGTTGDTEPDFSDVTGGVEITDGTVKWKVSTKTSLETLQEHTEVLNQKISNNMIVYCGETERFTINPSKGWKKSIVFTKPMPNVNYGISVNRYITGSTPYWSEVEICVLNKTTNGFIIATYNNSTVAEAKVTLAVTWMAIAKNA